MKASPTCTAAACTSDWQGAGGHARNVSQNSLAEFGPHGLGFERAARFLLGSRSRAHFFLTPSGTNTTLFKLVVPGSLRATGAFAFSSRPSFLEGLHNSFRNIRHWFGGGYKCPVCRRMAGRKNRPLVYRPVALTKILVGPDCGAFKFINTLGCTQALEIFDLNNVLHGCENSDGEVSGAKDLVSEPEEQNEYGLDN